MPSRRTTAGSITGRLSLHAGRSRRSPRRRRLGYTRGGSTVDVSWSTRAEHANRFEVAKLSQRRLVPVPVWRGRACHGRITPRKERNRRASHETRSMRGHDRCCDSHRAIRPHHLRRRLGALFIARLRWMRPDRRCHRRTNRRRRNHASGWRRLLLSCRQSDPLRAWLPRRMESDGGRVPTYARQQWGFALRRDCRQSWVHRVHPESGPLLMPPAALPTGRIERRRNRFAVCLRADAGGGFRRSAKLHSRSPARHHAVHGRAVWGRAAESLPLHVGRTECCRMCCRRHRSQHVVLLRDGRMHPVARRRRNLPIGQRILLLPSSQRSTHCHRAGHVHGRRPRLGNR